MPKKQNLLTPEEQRKRFEDEVRKRKKAGDFDQGAADHALERLVRNAGSKTTSPPD
jgi:hypothetical protein